MTPGVAALDPALSWTLRIALALLLLRAARHKLGDPAGFARLLRSYQLLPRAGLRSTARAVPLLELGAALGLLAANLQPHAALLSAGLFAVYGAALAAQRARGRREIECGCAGPAARERAATAPLIARNALLLAAALGAAMPASARAVHPLDALSIAGACALAALLYLSAEQLIVQHGRLAALRRSP